MSYSKRQLVRSALVEIGLAEYVFDMLPEQTEEALRRLDSMLAEWNGRGIRLAYPVPSNPENSDMDQDSGIPDMAWEAVITNLAIRIAPSFGKAVSAETKATARHALNTILAVAAMPTEVRLPSMPAGAGNKSVDDPFLSEGTNDVISHPDDSVSFG